MNYINMTPHPVRVLNDNHELVLELPPSGQTARVSEDSHFLWENQSDSIPVYVTTMLYSTCPDPEKGVYYVVSKLVALSLPERSDLLVPHGLVRDDNGRIIGCRGLTFVKPSEKTL